MKIENLKKLKSTNPIVQNAIAHCVARNEGTSEGAKKGWETRKAGGAGGADDDWDSMSETDRAIAERTAAKYGGTPKAAKKQKESIKKSALHTAMEKEAGRPLDFGMSEDEAREWGTRMTQGAQERGHGTKVARAYSAALKAHPGLADHPTWKELGDHLRSRKLLNSCGDVVHSTNPVVENALEYAANKACGVVKNYGTSEGARKGWETRERGQQALDDDAETRGMAWSTEVKDDGVDANLRQGTDPEAFAEHLSKKLGREVTFAESVGGKSRFLFGDDDD